MKKLLCAILALCLLIPATGMAAKEVVNVFNWEDYIDRSVIEQFEQETGITVNYMCFTTNEDMLVQVEANPGAFDVIFPSEYCVERLNGKGLLAEINYDNIPNSKYLREELMNPSYDPESKHSVPYMGGTLGILYGGGDGSVYDAMAAAFTGITAYSFLVFNLLCAPCFAAIGAIKREMNNRKWTWFAIGYQCGFAYVIALMINQFGGLFTGSANILGVIVAVALLAGMIYMLVRPYKEATKLSVK